MNALSDLRYAARSIRRNPWLSLVIVVVLAFGFGIVTAVFSVLDRALLRPLPSGSDPDRWVQIVVGREGQAHANANLSYPLYRDVRDRTRAFDAVLAHAPTNLTLQLGDEAIRLEAAGVSAGFFTALGVRFSLGREISTEEDVPGAGQPVAVLSHALWRTRFGADSAVLGRAVTLNGSPFIVIGVAPRDFLGPVRGAAEDAWIPITATTIPGLSDLYQRRSVSWLDVLARIAPGTSRTGAAAQTLGLSGALVADSLLPAGSRILLRDGAAGFTDLVGDLRQPLGVLFAASLIIVAIAGLNLAGLLLARATTRQWELAIRVALGATRGRLARLFLAEGALLALLGAGAGLGVAAWLATTAPTLRTLFGAQLLIPEGLDLRAFGLLALLALGVAAGIAAGPAFWSSRLEVGSGFRAATTSGDPAGQRLRTRLVVAQLSLAVVLVFTGGLLAVTTRRLASVRPGYDPAGIQLSTVDLQARGYTDARAMQFWEEMVRRLSGSPLVDGASVTRIVNPSRGGMRLEATALEASAVPREQVQFDLNMVGPGYFRLLGIPVLRGRAIETIDRGEAPLVAVINDAMARRYWPDQSALGRGIFLSGDSTRPAVVVGVVADGKYRSLREGPTPVVYLSALQDPPLTGTLLVRARAGTEPASVAALIRQTVRELDVGLPVFAVRSLAGHLELASNTERLLSFLALLYAGLAAALAAVGLFGLLSYAVQRQTREIGIRLALGADPSRIRRQVVWQGLGRGLIGIGLGLGLSIMSGRWVRAILYDVSPFDPLILLGVAGLMLAVALAASWLPAMRAARVDPMAALRSE